MPRVLAFKVGLPLSSLPLLLEPRCVLVQLLRSRVPNERVAILRREIALGHLKNFFGPEALVVLSGHVVHAGADVLGLLLFDRAPRTLGLERREPVGSAFGAGIQILVAQTLGFSGA